MPHSSYKSNLANWEENPTGKEPGYPKAGYVYPALYRDNMYKQTGAYTVQVKVWIRNTWDFISLELKKSDMDYITTHCKHRKQCVPTLQKRGKEWYLDFAFQEKVELQNTLEGDVEIKLKADFNVFGGIDAGQVAGIGCYGKIGGNGKLLLLTTNKNEKRGLKEFTLTGELGIKAYIGGLFTYEKPFKNAQLAWYIYSNEDKDASTPRSISKKTELYGVRNSEGSAMQKSELYSVRNSEGSTTQKSEMYNADNYKQESLDYLTKESQWKGYAMTAMGDDVKTSFHSLLTDTYNNAQPVMIAEGDIIYAAFLRGEANTNTVYAVCTKFENGVWSEPVRVDAEATMDNAPRLLTDAEGNLWLTYSKTTEAYDSLMTYAQNQRIVVGMVDKDTLEFTKVKEFDSHGYACNQQITLVNGVPTLVWMESEITDDSSVIMPKSTKKWM